jgi:hypothetical protein
MRRHVMVVYITNRLMPSFKGPHREPLFTAFFQ